MIKQIVIQNFQSHRNTSLELSEGVNVIIGPSDSGKTAILRALNWLINNRPLGDSFRSNWGGITEIEIELDNNDWISRNKDGALLNTYEIIGNNTKEFKAFKSDVPEEVKSLLNIDEINFQKQHDAPFLLFQSAGENARYLNKIVDLEIIDRSLSNVAKTLKEESNLLFNKKTQLKEIEEDLEKYNWIESAQKDIDKLSNIENDINEKENIIRFIKNILKETKSIKIKKLKYNRIIKREKEVNRLMDMDVKIEVLSSKISGVEIIINNIENTETKFKKIKKKRKELEKQFKEEMPNICPLCKQKIK